MSLWRILLGALAIATPAAGGQELPPAAPAAEAPQAEPADPAEPHEWWRRLGEDERERLRLRWGMYRELPPERQQALRQRARALEWERDSALRGMDERERREIEGRDHEERRRWIDQRVRERIRERGESLELRDPEFCRRLRDLPPEERMRHGERFFRERHRERARAELEKAVTEGWIGPTAGEWLRQAGDEELLAAVGQVQRWRFLQHAEQDGFWQRHPMSAEDRARLMELPTPFFFEEIRRLEGHRRPPGHGEAPHDRGEGPPRGGRPPDRPRAPHDSGGSR